MTFPCSLPCVLSIAGFDNCGGAGIQADLKTFYALGCHGASVLTVLPIQNTCGVRSIFTLPDKCVEEQLEAVFDDIKVDAIKIGVLYSKSNVQAVVNILTKYPTIPVVLDPVMGSSTGTVLLEEGVLEAMVNTLFPLVKVLTPNLNEASTLVGKPVVARNEMEWAAKKLSKKGPLAVLIKGGHLLGDSCEDCLFFEDRVFWLSEKRVKSQNTHGTGCTLSSAVAAYLAKGFDVPEAVKEAKKYLSRCLQVGLPFKVGLGKGPVNLVKQ